MNRTSQRQLWLATLILAGASAFISACGPQDETVMAARAVAQPAAAAHPITGAVQRIEPITDAQAGGAVSGYRVQVQLDGGALRTFEPTLIDGLKVGDRVRVEQGHLRRV